MCRRGPLSLFIFPCWDWRILYNLVLTEVESMQTLYYVTYSILYVQPVHAPSRRSCKSRVDAEQARTRRNSPLQRGWDDGCCPGDEDVVMMCSVSARACGSAHAHCVQGSGRPLNGCLSRGFHGGCSRRGLHYGVKHPLLQPCRVKQLHTGTFSGAPLE